MLEGNIDDQFVNVSDAVNAITSVKTCQEIVNEIGSAWV